MVNRNDFVEAMRKTQAPLFRMVEMVPDDRLDWAPGPAFMKIGQLLKHLTENWCIVRMMVNQEWPFAGPGEMEEAMKLEKMPSSGKAEALAAMRKDLDEAVEFIEKELDDEIFFNRRVSAPWGFEGEIWKAVLMAKEHQVNHKMQLHLYLKLLGLPVNTETLYEL